MLIMNNKQLPLRIIFAGSPNISATILNELIISSYIIVGIITQPNRLKGRKKNKNISLIKELALNNNIPIFEPIYLLNNKEIVENLKALKADIMVVVAYGLIIPKDILIIPKYGCINIHFSLLPKWRGAAPVQRSIEAGDHKTGITIIQMDEGLDTGNILYMVKCLINRTETSTSLYNKLLPIAISSLFRVLFKIQNGIKILPKKQEDDNYTYASKLTKNEGLINFNNRVIFIERKIRALSIWPSPYIIINQEYIKIDDVKIFKMTQTIETNKIGCIIDINKNYLIIQAKDGYISIGSIQFPGKKMLSIKNILNGKNLNHWIGKFI